MTSKLCRFSVHSVSAVASIPLHENVFDCRSSGREDEGVVYDNTSDLKPETKPYYQVLIDNRDIPYIVRFVI